MPAKTRVVSVAPFPEVVVGGVVVVMAAPYARHAWRASPVAAIFLRWPRRASRDRGPLGGRRAWRLGLRSARAASPRRRPRHRTPAPASRGCSPCGGAPYAG